MTCNPLTGLDELALSCQSARMGCSLPLQKDSYPSRLQVFRTDPFFRERYFLIFKSDLLPSHHAVGTRGVLKLSRPKLVTFVFLVRVLSHYRKG